MPVNSDLYIATMSRDVRVIRRPVNTSRRKRTVNIATTYLPLVTDRHESPKSVVCHRHAGGVVIVALDRSNRPVRAWSDVRDYQPIRCTYLDTFKLRSLVFERLRPDRLYVNCGQPLAPIPTIYSKRLIVYHDGLDLLLARLQKSFVGPSVTPSQRRPTYDEIRKLDPSITPNDYRKIYGL